jgi:hypothetical protein
VSLPDKSLEVVLSYLTGRKLRMDEIYAAVELSRSRYYEVQNAGELITPDRLVTAARNLDINPIDLLVEFGVIAEADLAPYTETGPGGRPFGLAMKRKARGRPRLADMKPIDDAPTI